MTSRKTQAKAGIRTKRRGQQTGIASAPDQNREEMKKTPPVRGKLKQRNEMFADPSTQHVGGDAVTPRMNSPATPAMTSGGPTGESAGEVGFKQRLAKKRKQ
ncbi:MAG: hypothetical protein QOD75_2643 [Blastocatellia bacterium]|jgi:hypothetical protein|nr:hypothetical protein [Blastocatellia bacterium]